MDIFYTKETLFVDFKDQVDIRTVNKLEEKVFNILETYDIENIVINILNENDFDQNLINNFLANYKTKFNGNMIIN